MSDGTVQSRASRKDGVRQEKRTSAGVREQELPCKEATAADGNGTPMAGSGNGSKHCKDATPLARRPGRPKGSKNKISSSFLRAQLESTSENNM